MNVPYRRKIRHMAAPLLGATALLFAAQAATARETAPHILAQAQSGPLHCQIQKNASGDLIALTGVISATRPVTGHAHFTLVKSGTSGSSNMAQDQRFKLTPGQDLVIGHVSTNLAPGGHILVGLRLRATDGSECHVQASLER